jgi:hypothetical protein
MALLYSLGVGLLQPVEFESRLQRNGAGAVTIFHHFSYVRRKGGDAHVNPPCKFGCKRSLHPPSARPKPGGSLK